MEQNREQRQLRALPITFQLYAYDEEEIEECRMAIIAFIGQHRHAGRAVSARTVAEAVSRWDRNALVRHEVIKYFT
jgi:hypothetical protein